MILKGSMYHMKELRKRWIMESNPKNYLQWRQKNPLARTAEEWLELEEGHKYLWYWWRPSQQLKLGNVAISKRNQTQGSKSLSCLLNWLWEHSSHNLLQVTVVTAVPLKSSLWFSLIKDGTSLLKKSQSSWKEFSQ